MILGIETSGSLCSIGWYENEQTLLEYNLEEEQVHSKVLADFFVKGMSKLSRSIGDISIAAIAIGPGSYTGLRIGMSFIKGLCYGSDIPIVGVSNFNVLALQAINNKFPFLALINANKGRAYYAKFENDAENFTESGIIEIENINRIASEQYGIISDNHLGITENKALLDNFSWVKTGHFKANFLCEAANNKFKKYGTDNLNNLEPMYLQAFAGIL